jgi:hypothetical protein
MQIDADPGKQEKQGDGLMSPYGDLHFQQVYRLQGCSLPELTSNAA